MPLEGTVCYQARSKKALLLFVAPIGPG